MSDLEEKTRIFMGSLRAAQDESEEEGTRANSAMHVFSALIGLENYIVTLEWFLERGRDSEGCQASIEFNRALYIRILAALEATPDALYVVDHGRPASPWKDVHDRFRANHNLGARVNLDDSDGRYFCFVLPKFNSDGSHEPLGEKDVPWNQE